MNIMDVLYLLFKITLVFITLLILTRMLGEKQIGQLTFFNYIAGITIGSIAANLTDVSNRSFIHEFIGLIWWCILTGLISLINLKSGKLRSIIDGQPSILIKKGNIIKKSLRKSHINMDDLSMLLRQQGMFSVKDVEYAILEPNGTLSVMKKPGRDNVTKSDMKIHSKHLKYIPSEIIVDGKIIEGNLKELNLSENWVINQLNNQNITSIEDVFYAEIQSDGTLFIDKN